LVTTYRQVDGNEWIVGEMMKGVDVLASNVPGPNPALCRGRHGRAVPCLRPAGAALRIRLFSYDGAGNLGITTDARPSPIAS
jgi:hypothetical protein